MVGIDVLLRLHCLGVPDNSIAAVPATWKVLGIQHHHVGM